MESWNYLSEIESRARSYATHFPRSFTRGEGIYIQDSGGNSYIDCLACAGALPLGHNHPDIVRATSEFILSGALQQTLDLSTPAKCEFTQELYSHLPAEFRQTAKVHFCGPTGSDAVEAAIKLAKYYSQRPNILAFHGAYHGMTAGALGAMGNLTPKTGISLAATGVQFMPFPYRFRCPFGSDGSETDRLSINYIKTILTDTESGTQKPAAILVEIIQGEGGCIPASNEWVRQLREVTLEHDVLLIVDEVQTGIGRTGAMFAFEHANIKPDILVLSKAIGGGYPLAVILYDRRLDVWPSGMHAGTFRGNQLAMVAGQATLRFVRDHELVRRVAITGSQLSDGLEDIARRFKCLGEVRGRGLMVGVEIVDPYSEGTRPPPDGEMALAIKSSSFAHGLIVETGGRHGSVVRFLPPLIITEAEIATVLDRFENAVGSVQRSRGRM